MFISFYFFFQYLKMKSRLIGHFPNRMTQNEQMLSKKELLRWAIVKYLKRIFNWCQLIRHHLDINGPSAQQPMLENWPNVDIRRIMQQNHWPYGIFRISFFQI